MFINFVQAISSVKVSTHEKDLVASQSSTIQTCVKVERLPSPSLGGKTPRIHLDSIVSKSSSKLFI